MDQCGLLFAYQVESGRGRTDTHKAVAQDCFFSREKGEMKQSANAMHTKCLCQCRDQTQQAVNKMKECLCSPECVRTFATQESNTVDDVRRET